MGKWELVRLGDYIEQIRGVSYKPEDALANEDETHKPILRAHNIQSNGLNDNNLIYIAAKKIKNNQFIRKGDIVVCASSGSKDLVGKAAQASTDMVVSFGAFCKIVRAKATIDSSYLKHYFSSPIYRHVISELSAGANINNLRNEHIDNLCIPLPPLDVQKKIADVLDKASALIELRKAQLDKLDLLIKSQFVEMFGIPLKNPKRWSEQTIEDVCDNIFGGGTPSKSQPKYFTGTIPWISPKDMKSPIIADSMDHITEEAVQNSTTNLVPENSVLMVIRSGILKRNLPVAINTIPVTINQDMKAFIPNASVTSQYLMYFFKAIEPDVLSGVRAVTADNIVLVTLKGE